MHLSSLTFDPLGAVAIDCTATTTLGDMRRRVNRVATLDGGAAFNDFGYSEADRTIRLRWTPKSPEHEAQIARLLRLYARLHLATSQGVWIVAPEAYIPGAQQSQLTLLSVEKLTED
ncbi:hypothetical protein [Thauera aromatica]|uniref:hypothetical protein n=1 Tax=Thauera aromatica TaxID=59405 RepID=UPI001FFD06BF|nr:hypothetical protein [Thauera aromatica]MCK2095625.1 hypothetical protein [Thauera aromatica]